MDDSLEATVAAQVAADRVVMESWGFADVASAEAMQTQTTCNWFSMTELVTATAAVHT